MDLPRLVFSTNYGMIITETRLRQIIKKELLNLLEGRQPTEDLTILFSLLNQLGAFHFGGAKEEETLSNLTEIELKLDELINEVKNIKFGINEARKGTLSYYFGREQNEPVIEPENELQTSIKLIKQKLRELEDVINEKRAGKTRQYNVIHRRGILPKLKYIENKLRVLVQSNTAYPARTALTKRDILRRVQRGY